MARKMATAYAAPAGFLLPASETPAGGWRWSCRVEPKAGRRSTVHLSGSLHVAWAGRVAAGLAARNIGVVRASARRRATDWTAEIEIEVLGAAAVPSPLDFVALMREHAGPPDAGPLALASFRVTPARRDLQVEVRGADAVGFLGRLLLLFAELRLFPREMRVETVGAEVRDVFFLEGAGGGAPPEAIVAALRRRLEERLALRPR